MSEAAATKPSAIDVVNGTREIIAEALACEIEDVHANSILISDLDAESLDFLDIVFKLEQTFGIEITRGEMERAARGDMSEEEFAPKGVLSDAGLGQLRKLMPEAANQIKPGLRPMEILGLFSVQTFANIVSAKLDGRAA